MGTPYRILLADDDEAVLFTIEEMLKLQGWDCSCVTGAPQVSSHLRNGDFDILITDHMMPGNEGLELLQSVNRDYPELPIIVITGNASLPSAITSLQQEAFDYIPKPLDMDYLLKRVKEGAERYRLQKALRESEERSRALLSAIPDILFLQTQDGTFVDYYTPGDTQLYTLPTQIRGRKADALLPHAIAEKGLECIRKALQTGKLQSFEYELPIQDDPHYWEARIVPCGDNMALTIVRNITERRKSEEALMKSSRLEATATLAGGIAHDFNNLMVGVLGECRITQDSFSGTAGCPGHAF